MSALNFTQLSSNGIAAIAAASARFDISTYKECGTEGQRVLRIALNNLSALRSNVDLQPMGNRTFVILNSQDLSLQVVQNALRTNSDAYALTLLNNDSLGNRVVRLTTIVSGGEGFFNARL